ncbi:MAG: hypothetical protein B6I28_05370 [Fusobacteriia bacterium 4572_132]|nr:MAG: hypothetical protein B6I28_05370 [Fusobacteriia bacterium 4572_132]
MLLLPEIQVDTYWTSLVNELPQKVVRLYNAHGTNEQFHSEIKSDMGVEKLPSGKFNTNYLILQLGMIAYNILRVIGQKSLEEDDTPLKTKVFRKRVRTIMQNLIYFAFKISSHARKTRMKISKGNVWANTFKRLEMYFSRC